MKIPRGAVAMYVGLVFASGAVLGAFGQRLYTASSVSAKTTRNPEEFRKRVLATMQRSCRAGFYTSLWGPLPYAFATDVPPDDYDLVRLLVPMTRSKSSATAPAP